MLEDIRMTQRKVRRIGATGPEGEEDYLVQEFPLTLFLNGEELSTMLCTPEHLEDLVVGFLYFEGLIHGPQDIHRMQFDLDRGICRIEAEEPSEMVKKLYNRRTITSGCMSGGNLYRAIDAIGLKEVRSDLRVPASRLNALVTEMQRESTLFKETGGAHAAALCSVDGVEVVREDIGRHNTVDKIAGHCLRQGVDTRDKIIVTTGRISSEMLIKSAKVGLPVVGSRTAPTNLSATIADKVGVTLVAFIRNKRMNVYTRPERILDDLPEEVEAVARNRRR